VFWHFQKFKIISKKTAANGAFQIIDNSRFSLVFLLIKLLGTVYDGTTVLVRFWIKNYENQPRKYCQSPI